jgi:hypothetical protein
MMTEKQIELIEETYDCFARYTAQGNIWFYRYKDKKPLVWYNSIENRFNCYFSEYSILWLSDKEFFKRLKLLAFE